MKYSCFFFFKGEDGIRDMGVTGVQTCALPILSDAALEATACDQREVDPELTGEPPHGGPGVGARKAWLVDRRQIRPTRHDLAGTRAVAGIRRRLAGPSGSLAGPGGSLAGPGGALAERSGGLDGRCR